MSGSSTSQNGEREQRKDGHAFAETLQAPDDERSLVSSPAQSSPAGSSHASHSGSPHPAETVGTSATVAPHSAAQRLAPGDTLGRYRILKHLGQGGMGVVYAAHDEDLDRTVALKLLHTARMESSTKSNAERVRLLREARAIARLGRHPNVIQVYDVATIGNRDFVAMEYIEGQSLDIWLREQSRPWTEVMRVFLAAGKGLLAAHEAGVIHRDFKPANVLLAGDERVLVTDFGLARVPADGAPADHTSAPSTETADTRAERRDPTPARDVANLDTLQQAKSMSSRTARPAGKRAVQATSLTRTGAIMGTPAYMSPEQHRGQKIDASSDQYSFCVALFEGLYGERPFLGASLKELAASKRDRGLPRPDALATAGSGQSHRRVPLGIWRVLQRGTALSPDERYPSMVDVLSALRRAQSAPARRHRLALMSALMALLAGAALALAWWLVRPGPGPTPAPEPPSLQVGKTMRLTAEVGMELDPALSPDGAALAYIGQVDGRMQVHVHDLKSGARRALAGELPGDHLWPQWSADGHELFILIERTMYSIALDTGAARPVATIAGDAPIQSVARSPDGNALFYATMNAIVSQPITGGTGTRVTRVFEPHSLALSSDGQRLAYVSGNPQFVIQSPIFPNVAPASIWVIDLHTGARVQVTEGKYLDTSPEWSADGKHLLFISNRDGSRDIHMVAVPEPGAQRPAPTRLTTGLGAHSLILSPDNRQLAYASLSMRANIWSVQPSSASPPSLARANPVTRGNQLIESMSVSPDGTLLAFDSNIRGTSQDLYIMDLQSGDVRQLTEHAADDFAPTWSPDGRHIAFHSFRAGNRDLYAVSIDGGQAVALTTTSDRQELAPDWSPDGRSLTFFASVPDGMEIYVMDRDAQGVWQAPRQLTRGGGRYPRWSPDGQWIAYLAGYHSGAASTGLTASVGIDLLSRDGVRVRSLLQSPPGADIPRPFHLRWADDGQVVYYIAYEDDGTSSFWSVPSVGGVPTRVTQPYQQLIRVDFDVSGEDLYFTLKEHDSDIWLMALSSER